MAHHFQGSQVRKVKWEHGDTISSIANYDQIQILKSTICLRDHLPPVLSLPRLFMGLNLACCLATEQLGSDDFLCLPVTCQPSHIPSPRHIRASVLPVAFQMLAALSLEKSTAARLPLTQRANRLGVKLAPLLFYYFFKHTNYSFLYYNKKVS